MHSASESFVQIRNLQILSPLSVTPLCIFLTLHVTEQAAMVLMESNLSDVLTDPAFVEI